MKRIILFVMFFSAFSHGCMFSIECEVDVTKEYVYFDHCYNGLTINRLSVSDTLVKRFPRNYRNESKVELILDDANYFKSKPPKVFFNKRDSHIAWRIYMCDNYDDGMCFPDNNNYIVKDTIELFQPNTWYLFSFSNPHFRVFAFCDNDNRVRFVKEEFNTNF